MSYILSQKSKEKLSQVHPKLKAVVERAIQLSSTDFSVLEGLRTVEQQRQNVRKGVSQTMNSMHLRQATGYSHAVDLVPYPLNWDAKGFYPIAKAIQQAAQELNTAIRWGGAWVNITSTKDSPESLVLAYTNARRKLGKKAFIDMPHFEVIL